MSVVVADAGTGQALLEGEMVVRSPWTQSFNFPNWPAQGQLIFPEELMTNRAVEIRVGHEDRDAAIWGLLSVTDNIDNATTHYYP